MLELREVKKQAVQDAILEADKGIFVSQEAVHDWMDSWDTENELPKPKANIFLKKQFMYIVYLESFINDIEWMKLYFNNIFPVGKNQASIHIKTTEQIIT